MVLISGVLKGPYGDPRSGVTITMRSIKTSSTVLNLAKSQSVTDDGGKYSLSVEPGAYEVIVSVYGSQPERVGTIEVYTDSLPGTLNDFLRRPGESDITPEIVQTVDRLRAEAALSAEKSAVSAAAAKQSEVNSGLNAGMLAAGRYRMPGTGASPTWVHLGTVNGLVQTGDTLRIEVTGSAGYNGRSDQNGIATIVLRTGAGGGSGGGATINVRGRAGMTIYQQSGISLPIMDAAFTEVAENRYEIYLKLGAYNNRSFYVLSFENIASSQRAWTHVGVPKEPPTPPNDMMLTFVKVWNDYATTVDANGFIKKASPIARLSSAPEKMFDDYLDGFTLSGCAAVNGEAEGVSAERVSVGVYKITGALGFAEEGWNIEVPQDVNGNRLCFVSTNTGKDGTIYVKVSKRRFDIDTAAIVAGEPMDIPAGRWIDLRLAMPVREAVEVLPPEALVLNDDTPSETNAVS